MRHCPSGITNIPFPFRRDKNIQFVQYSYIFPHISSPIFAVFPVQHAERRYSVPAENVMAEVHVPFPHIRSNIYLRIVWVQTFTVNMQHSRAAVERVRRSTGGTVLKFTGGTEENIDR